MNDSLSDRKNFEMLFKQHYSKLCFISKGYINDDFEVEEIVCETFVKLWNNRANTPNINSIGNYLIKSVINACIDYHRREKIIQKNTLKLEENEIVCNTLADLDENPLDYLIEKEQQEIFYNAIENLPERYKMTFKLCRMEGLSYEETARVMGISKNTVKSNLKDVMEILRKNIKNLSACILLFISSLS